MLGGSQTDTGNTGAVPRRNGKAGTWYGHWDAQPAPRAEFQGSGAGDTGSTLPPPL